MLGVSASTLSRRHDLDRVLAGQWTRLRPRQVMILAEEYEKKVLNEVAASLIDYAHKHAPAQEAAVIAEVDVFLVEAMENYRKVRSMAGLDVLIRIKAKERQKVMETAKTQGLQDAMTRAAASDLRQMAMRSFVMAFDTWQGGGYSFGKWNKQIALKQEKGRAEVWRGRASLSADETGKEDRYVEIELSESARPWDSMGQDRALWRNEEANGVLVSSGIYKRVRAMDWNEWDYKLDKGTKVWYGMEQMEKLNESLVEMLQAVVDAINPPEVEVGSGFGLPA